MTDTSKENTGYPSREEGRALSGVCERCEESIRSYHDHAEDCLWSNI